MWTGVLFKFWALYLSWYLWLEPNYQWKGLCKSKDYMRPVQFISAVTVCLTCGDVVLCALAVSFDEEGGGEEETSTHHGREGAEQHRELQRAKLPEERVRLPQRVWNLRHRPRWTTVRGPRPAAAHWDLYLPTSPEPEDLPSSGSEHQSQTHYSSP